MTEEASPRREGTSVESVPNYPDLVGKVAVVTGVSGGSASPAVLAPCLSGL
jgi:hypothetical protein